ncbi:sugar kinase [Microbacterium pumilum]|uniref:Sugar kinase n=1 Tax=Microbacterium pumilum TaxID=344165 RepID=A0ABP5EKA2_9MICO
MSDTMDHELLTIGETMALVSAGKEGGLTMGASLALSAGGAESNVAIGAARLGVRAAWASRVGNDPLGALVTGSVLGRGVDTSAVTADPLRRTGLMVKEPSPTGSRVFYYRTDSAASSLSLADIARFPAARVVHVSGVTPALSDSARTMVENILNGAMAPAITSFDVNFRPALWGCHDVAASVLLKLARRADIVFVGRDEAESLWGTTTVDSVRRLLPAVSHLIVKDGAIEAVEFHSSATVRIAASAVEVVEPVGAGDAFAAGWIAGYLRGNDAAVRLQIGHESAAAVLRSPYDTAIPDEEEAGR